MATTTKLSITKLELSTAQPETPLNTALDILDSYGASNPALLFSRKATTTTGLTWGYHGGTINLDGVQTTIGDGTVALTASLTNYVETTRSGTVSRNTSAFSADRIPLYEVVCGTSTITSYTDRRDFIRRPITSRLVKAMPSDANYTLTAAEARAEIIEISGGTSLTAQRDIVVPLPQQEWTVYNASTGGRNLRFIGTSGTGVVVENGVRAQIYSDGTNIQLRGKVHVGKQMRWVPAADMRPSATAGCAALAVVAIAAGQPDVISLDFDTTTAESAQFAFSPPLTWDLGTVTFEAVWSHAAATTFGVAWQLQGLAASDDDTMAAAFGTAVTVTDTGGTTNDSYRTAESGAVTIAGTPAQHDTVFFRVLRDPANGSDTLDVDARLHGIRLFFTTY